MHGLRTRMSVVIGSVGIAMLMSAAPTAAMTDLAEFDGTAHPAVVALLYRTPDGSRAYQYCTGTLISPTVVLTASHCNDGLLETGWDLIVTNDPVMPPVDATGWFDADLKNVADVTQVVTNPRYERGYRDDVSAQVIAKPLGVGKRDFPALPAVGVLDRMQSAGTLKSTPTTVLGYGTIEKVVVPGSGPVFLDSSERRSAVLFTKSLDSQWLHQEMSISKGQGGACYGDSGGPSLMQLNAN
ncbi:MAG TPA: trypsin-like serine protease [Dermatophilaceae bacterium]|nr:trypsin-like serine protease [Dermatophilaceae bacterium]